MCRSEFPIILLGEEWNERARKLDVAHNVLPVFYGPSSNSAMKWGVVDGDVLLSCLWGTTRNIGEFYIATRTGHGLYGYARRLVENYIRSNHDVRRFETRQTDPAVCEMLAGLDFGEEIENGEGTGLWFLEMGSTSSRS